MGPKKQEPNSVPKKTRATRKTKATTPAVAAPSPAATSVTPAVATMTDYKPSIVAALQVLLKKEQQERQAFKARAYAKVISELNAHAGPIARVEDIDGIPGIGGRIREKIAEMITTGHIAAADQAREEGILTTDELLKVYGIGPAKAKELADAGIRSVAALRAAAARTPGLLNDKQQVGLKYYDDLLARIPRAEVAAHEAKVKAAFRAADPSFVCQVVGSYRRGATDSGDVDVLVKMPAEAGNTAHATRKFGEAIEHLQASGYILEVLAQGAKKFMGIVAVEGGRARRLDLLLTPPEEFAYAILYFTGSDRFNVGMRKHALSLGWSLNEHGLKRKPDDGATPPADLRDEEDIFRFLGVPFVAPTARTNFVAT